MAEETSKDKALKLFGEIDRQRDGRISSEYPAWMNTVQVRNLGREITRIETALRRGHIPHDRVWNEKETLEMLKVKLHKIEESKPHLSDREKDRMDKLYKAMSKEISALMPTRSMNERGLVNSHDEVKLMTEPCIAVPSDLHDIVMEAGVSMIGGKLSRNAATKVFKIAGHLLEKPTNVEWLRKDK